MAGVFLLVFIQINKTVSRSVAPRRLLNLLCEQTSTVACNMVFNRHSLGEEGRRSQYG